MHLFLSIGEKQASWLYEPDNLASLWSIDGKMGYL